MALPSISFLVPTHSPNRPLECYLASLVVQIGTDDECIVIGDTCDGPLPAVEALVKSFGEQFHYVEHDAGVHDYGHSQLNYGISIASGDFIHCCDDDDILTNDAVKTMRHSASIYPGRPLMFRFLSYHGLVFWDHLGLLAQDHIGGHCLLAPNIPGKLALWGPHYQGDFTYVMETVMLHGGIDSVVWQDHLVAIARPTAMIRQHVLHSAGRSIVPA